MGLNNQIRRQRLELWLLAAPAVALTLGVAATYGQSRFRATAEPSLVIFAAVAVVTLSTRLSERRAKTAGDADSLAAEADVAGPV